MGRFKDIDDLIVAILFWSCCLFALLALCGFTGCACFQHTRVEARADYNVIAKEPSVSIICVGYSD